MVIHLESDVFRKAYRQLSPDETITLEALKTKAEELLQIMQGNVPKDAPGAAGDKISVEPRAAALARTNLEQAVMWAVKSITG